MRKIRARSAAAPTAAPPAIRAEISRASSNTLASTPPAYRSRAVSPPRTPPTSLTTTNLPFASPVPSLLFSAFPLRPQRLCVIFFLLFSSFPKTQNHTPRAWRALPHSSQIPRTLAPLPYFSRPSRQSLPVQAPDASPPEFPSVSHRAWPARPPAIAPQSPPVRFPTAQIAPLAKYFLHTRAWS